MTDNPILDPVIRELMNTAATGEAAKLFLQSELVRHVTQRAADDIDEAIAKLCEVNPNEAQAIQALQFRINVAKQSVIYLTESMAEGENAMRQLNDDN